MKQTVEEAAREARISSAESLTTFGMHQSLDDFTGMDLSRDELTESAFIKGAEWQKEQMIEALSSVLEDWVHGGDADCIIAELEEKLK